MAKTEILMTVEKVTDCDTGDYHIGELDYGIKVGALESYLENYGFEGKKELIYELGFLICKVEEYWQDLQKKNASGETLK